MSRAQVMPRLRISALSWICVLGNCPPFTKKIFTPSSSTASPTIANVNITVAIICIFKSKPVPIITTMQPSIARWYPVLSKKTCKVSDTLRLSARFFANIFSQHPFKPLDLTIIQSDKGKLTLPPHQCPAPTAPLARRRPPPSVYCRPVACFDEDTKNEGANLVGRLPLRGRLPTLPLSQYHRRGEA